MKYLITSVEGKTEKKDIRDFVDNYLIAKDSRALREYIKEIQPDVDMSFFPSEGSNRISIPLGSSFFGLTSETAPKLEQLYLHSNPRNSISW
jgi:hypothetical protein